jgi:hypothetical protein
MTQLKVSPSGQVYDIDLAEVRVTRDGQGHFIHLPDLEQALAKKKEIEVFGAFGGPPP